MKYPDLVSYGGLPCNILIHETYNIFVEIPILVFIEIHPKEVALSEVRVTFVFKSTNSTQFVK